MKWESRARKGGGELGGYRLQGGVEGAPVLRDECGGGVDRGFGLALLQFEGRVPIFFIRCFQYPSSSARNTQVVSSPSFAAPGTMRRMFWLSFLLLFRSGAPYLRLLSHHDVRSLVGICPYELLTTFPIKVNCCFASWFRIVGMLKNSSRRD